MGLEKIPSPQLEYRYDGTFTGFLTLVFDVFDRKEQPTVIVRPGTQSLLFANIYEVITSDEKSERVWNGIIKTGGAATGEHLYYAYLSREEGAEMAMLNYCQHLFASKRMIMTDLAHPDVLAVHQLFRKVDRESHRVLMFLRFEQAADGTYFAPYAPKYDVIPMTVAHFKSRFADQNWLIYDTLRQYGIYYNAAEGKAERITIDNAAFNPVNGQLLADAAHPSDDNWQALWQAYFKSTAIAERKNLLLQKNHMPKRFWKYLTEKRI